MKRLFKTLSILSVLLVAIVVAAVAVLSSLDFNDYKGVIAEEVKNATGRDLKISGDLKLHISLTPSLYVDGVTFANAPWGSRPEMVSLKRLEAEVALLPLLSREVDVKRVILVGLDLLAETDKQGRGNWQFGADSETPVAQEAPGGGVLPVIRQVHVEDLRLTYRDGRTGAETRLTLPALDLEADGADAPLRVSVNGDVNGEEFRVKGTVGSLRGLTSGKELPIDISVRGLAAEVRAKGAIADPKAMTGLGIVVSAKGDSIAKTVEIAGRMVPALAAVKLPDLGPYDVAATVSGTGAKPSLSNIKASLGRPGETSVTAAGSVADVIKTAGINVQVSATVKEPTALAKGFGAEVPDLPGILASARVKDQDGGYQLSEMNVKIGASDLRGTMGVRLGGARPKVSGDLQSALLDLDELLPKTSDAKDTKPAADGRLFPNDPLPLEGLKAADADIKLAVATLRVNKMDVTAVRVAAVLQAGRLIVKPLQATVADGTVSGEISLGADQSVPPLAVNLNIAKLDYGKLVAMTGEKPVAEGTADVALKVNGAGTSVREIMAGLDGRLRVVSEKGKIESSMLNIASADIMSALPLVDSKGDKDLRCAVVDFDIVDGIANAKALVVETGGLSVVGVGGVNLRDEKLNIVLEPRAKKTSLLSAAMVPVAVRGTLANPEPKVNPTDLVTGVASNVASGAAAIMTMGLSVVVQGAFNRATSTDETDYCSAALAGKTVTPSTATAKPQPSQPQKSQPGVGDTLKNLEQGLGGLKGLLGK